VLRDIESGSQCIAVPREIASIEPDESRMPKSRPPDVMAGLRSRPKRFLPGQLLSRKVGDPSPPRPPIERVIQITQARLENQSIEDTATHEMTPFRPQTPLQCRFEGAASQESALTTVI
jgi:hypothetical protein